MVPGFELGFGERGGGVDVMLISFGTYGTLIWRSWLCRCM